MIGRSHRIVKPVTSMLGMGLSSYHFLFVLIPISFRTHQWIYVAILLCLFLYMIAANIAQPEAMCIMISEWVWHSLHFCVTGFRPKRCFFQLVKNSCSCEAHIRPSVSNRKYDCLSRMSCCNRKNLSYMVSLSLSLMFS